MLNDELAAEETVNDSSEIEDNTAQLLMDSIVLIQVRSLDLLR